MRLVNDRIELTRDAETYLWLADRRTNPAYATPDYYVCITTPSMRGLLEREIGKEPRTGRCSNIALVQRAQSTSQTMMRFTLVERDESPADAWAVVRLNWELLPYLRPLTTGNPPTWVVPVLDRSRPNLALTATYQYVDPYGRPERGTVIRLYAQQEDGGRQLLHQEAGTQRIELPAGFRGTVVVSVAPSDGTRSGPEYFSEPLEVSSS